MCLYSSLHASITRVKMIYMMMMMMLIIITTTTTTTTTTVVVIINNIIMIMFVITYSCKFVHTHTLTHTLTHTRVYRYMRLPTPIINPLHAYVFCEEDEIARV